MTLQAYLTIDDSPSGKTNEMTDYLLERNIPALLFVRGDALDENPEPVIKAIQDGFVIGNHNYSHTRASQMTYMDCVAEIEKTDELIDDAYRDAGISRPAKYFRFPHMDRGCGGWVVDYDAYPDHKEKLLSLFADGLNVSLDKPNQADIDKKWALQNYLRREGFISAFADVQFPWYQDTEMAEATDAMFTYSTSDWMLNQRHLEKDWPYKTVDDLNHKFDQEVLSGKSNDKGPHIILAHDQAEISHKTLALIQHMLNKGVEFLPIKS